MPDDSFTPEPLPQPPDSVRLPATDLPVVTPPIEAPPAVPPLEEPGAVQALPPQKPGPGLLAAIGWMLLFLVLEVVLLIPWFLVMGTGGNMLGVVLITINFALEIGLVVVALRRQLLRILAIRAIHPAHVLLVLLLVLPTETVTVGTALWLESGTQKSSKQEMPEIYRGLTTLPMPALLLVACLLPALGEEILFRGFLARGLVARHGLVVGVAVSSLIFGLMHLDSVPHFIATTLLGIALYVVFLCTKTIWAPFLLHGVNNAVAFGAAKLFTYFGVDTSDDGSAISISLVLTAIAAVVTLMVLLYQTRARWILPDGSFWNPGYLTAETPPAPLAAQPQVGRPQLWAVAAAVAACGGFGWVLATSI